MRISDWSSDVCSSDLTACGFVEGSTARDDPESRVVDVAIYDLGGKVLFGEVFDTGSGEHCATSVFAGDDDVGSCFEIPQIEEDPVGALPVDVAGDDCRSRSEERRDGQEGGSTLKSRGWP